MPTEQLEGGNWLHPSRLPLGGGWAGYCCASGDGRTQPTPGELREFCNLGYAASCSRLPGERNADALRFTVIRDDGTQLTVMFVFELAHRPAGHGTLQYDLRKDTWLSSHPEPRIQKMAECYLESYLHRRRPDGQILD